MQLSHADGGFLHPRTDMRTTFLALQIFAVGCLASCMPHARAYVGASFMRVEGDMALQDAVGNQGGQGAVVPCQPLAGLWRLIRRGGKYIKRC